MSSYLMTSNGSERSTTTERGSWRDIGEIESRWIPQRGVVHKKKEEYQWGTIANRFFLISHIFFFLFPSYLSFLNLSYLCFLWSLINYFMFQLKLFSCYLQVTCIAKSSKTRAMRDSECKYKRYDWFLKIVATCALISHRIYRSNKLLRLMIAVRRICCRRNIEEEASWRRIK